MPDPKTDLSCLKTVPRFLFFFLLRLFFDGSILPHFSRHRTKALFKKSSSLSIILETPFHFYFGQLHVTHGC